MVETMSVPGPAAQATAPGLTVYYDGSCPLCRREIEHYRGCEGADSVAFVDVSSQEADQLSRLPDGLDRDAALARFHVRDGDGTILSGAPAFAALWLRLPGWRWIGRLAAHPPISWLMAGAYPLFLLVRPGMQRLARALEPRERPPGGLGR